MSKGRRATGYYGGDNEIMDYATYSQLGKGREFSGFCCTEHVQRGHCTCGHGPEMVSRCNSSCCKSHIMARHGSGGSRGGYDIFDSFFNPFAPTWQPPRPFLPQLTYLECRQPPAVRKEYVYIQQRSGDYINDESRFQEYVKSTAREAEKPVTVAVDYEKLGNIFKDAIKPLVPPVTEEKKEEKNKYIEDLKGLFDAHIEGIKQEFNERDRIQESRMEKYREGMLNRMAENEKINDGKINRQNERIDRVMDAINNISSEIRNLRDQITGPQTATTINLDSVPPARMISTKTCGKCGKTGIPINANQCPNPECNQRLM